MLRGDRRTISRSTLRGEYLRATPPLLPSHARIAGHNNEDAFFPIDARFRIGRPSRSAAAPHLLINRRDGRGSNRKVLHGKSEYFIGRGPSGGLCPVEIVMNDGGIRVVAVWTQQRPKYSRYARKISYES